jgi:dipeptidyl aminopeptidase/acylaminoacyl peptidase
VDSLKVSELAKIIEDVVSISSYTIIGCTKRGVLLYGMTEGVGSLLLFDLKDRKLRKVSRYPVVGVARPYPEAYKVIYLRDLGRGAEKHEVRIVDLEKNIDEKLIHDVEPMRIISIAYDERGVAFSGVTHKDIAIYYFDGSKTEKISTLPGMGFVTSLEGSLIAGNGSLKGDSASMEVFVIDLNNRELKIFTPRPGSVNKLVTLYNGKVYFESNATGKNQIMTLDPDTGKITPLEGKGDYKAFSPSEHLSIEVREKFIALIGKKEGKSRAFINWREVPAPPGTVNGLAVCENRIYLSLTSLNYPTKVVEVASDLSEHKIVYESRVPEYLRDLLKSEVKLVYIESSDGVKVPTFVIKKRKRAPTVIYVHGGPWSEVMDEWRPIIAALIAAGFNVVAPNFRGSTGYGEPYRLMDIGDPGGGDLEDVLAAARWSVKEGIADERNLYIMGYSYGGYMTLWAMVSRPGIFRCGVAGAAITDWEEMYSLSDAIFKKFIDVLFSNKRELLKERSPITKVENLKDPICIVQPQNDSRTPLKPVLNFVKKLHDLEKDFEFHVVPNMGHVITTVDDAIRILLPMLSFLKRCSK